MKAVSGDLLAYIQATGGAELATCWYMKLTNDVEMFFTDHDTDIVFGGQVYIAKTGYSRSAVASNSGLAVDNLELEGAVAGGGIEQDDLRDGIYDFAEVEVFMVAPNNPEYGKVVLKKGVLGELQLNDGIYVAEIRGMTQFLSRPMVKTYQPECNARIYDSRCTVDPGPFTNSGIITEIVRQRREIKATLTGTARTAGFFRGGLIRFTSGAAINRWMEVKHHTVSGGVHELVLLLDIQRDLTVGNTFSIRRGCDQLLETCKNVFGNVVNFRGFPDVPGFDLLTWYPDDKSKKKD